METGSRVEALGSLFDHSGTWLMTNTVLAWIPVVVAAIIFRSSAKSSALRRSATWWAGLAVFVLFLPNAPYVVTDLVHVRGDIQRLGADAPVATTVLPVYAIFVASGFLAYYVSLALLTRYLDRCGFTRHRGLLIMGLHALVAVGVFLGRWSRLNSWEPLMSPLATAERVVGAFAWSAAPVLIGTLFVVTLVGHAVTKTLAEAATVRLRSVLGRVLAVRDHVA